MSYDEKAFSPKNFQILKKDDYQDNKYNHSSSTSSNQLKLLIVTPYFWPENFIINGFAEDFVKRGHQVQVYTGYPNYPKGQFFKNYFPRFKVFKEQRNGVEVIRFPIISRRNNLIFRILNYFSFIFFGIIYSFFVPFKKNDLIFSYNPSPATSCLVALFLKHKLNLKLAFWVQDLWPETLTAFGFSENSKIYKLVTEVIRIIYKGCDQIFIPSRSFRKSIIKLNGDNEKIYFVPNWAEPNENSKEVQVDWVNQLRDGFSISFAGNIGKAQNLHMLISAIDKLKDKKINFFIAGDGSEKENLMKLVRDLNLTDQIFFLGQKPSNEMHFFFQKSHVLFVSLVGAPVFEMAIPSKIQAYMQSGRPILAAIGGEASDLIIDAKCGWVCPPDDVNQLASTLFMISNLSDQDRKIYSENAFKYYQKHFEKKKVIDHIEELFIQIKK